MRKRVEFINRDNPIVFHEIAAIIFFILFMMLCSLTLRAQTITWDGSESTNWHDPDNWDTGNIPIDSDIILIPDLANDPVITTNAFASEIDMDSGTSLTIESMGSLTIPSAGSDAMYINGNIVNNGTLSIDNVEGVGLALRPGSSFVNNGTMLLGQNDYFEEGAIGGNNATFTNTSTGVIHIDNVDETALGNNFNSVFTNYGTITIGANEAVAQGMSIGATFSNETTGVINIVNASHGIRMNSPNFENKGTINIGKDGSIRDEGIEFGTAVPGLDLVLDNTGTINIENTGLEGVLISTSGVLNNDGMLIIKNCAGDGIENINELNNQANGTIQLSDITGLAINNTTMDFTNSGMIRGVGSFDLGGAELSGTTSPGSSPGTISFSSNQTFASTHKMIIEVDGTTPNTQHDQVIVTGTATLGGTLEVDVNYLPTDGDRIVFLTATTINGTFDDITPALPAGWVPDYSMAGQVAIVYSAVLPVELHDFQVRKANNQEVLISWQTSSETNNSGFEVLHSQNGRMWTSLDFVQGAGNSNTPQQYQYLHKLPNRNNYYRLKQVDFDGEMTYSAIKSMNIDLAKTSIQIFPNPVSDVITIKIQEEFEQGQIKLFNALGQLVKAAILNGDQVRQLQVNELPKGKYYIQIHINGIQEISSILIR